MPRPEFRNKKHQYFLDDDLFPSVTQIIKATVPKDLTWWGMTIGVDGIMALFDKGYGYRVREAESVQEVVDLLTEHKLTVNHRMQEGGDRGKALHTVLEKWGEEGIVPDLGDFNKQEQPYVQALCKWIIDTEPDLHEYETLTGSLEYHYAGQWDAKCTLTKGEYKNAYVLLDLKTTKRVYADQHFPQVEAYEQAEVECGEKPTDFRAILQVGSDADYSFARSTDTFEDFRVLLDHHKSITDRKVRLKNVEERV